MNIEEAIAKYSFVRRAEDGMIELFADHHMLSSLRTCEAYFTESIINSITPIGGRAWSLSFGLWFHESLEWYYLERFNEREFSLSDFLKIGAAKWAEHEMEDFKDYKQYKDLGACEGALAILSGYYNAYYGWRERLKVVGSELAFGFDREVPIGEFWINPYVDIIMPFKIRCYLTGRVDLIVDDGTFIGPLDHKTTSYFDGSEGAGFKPHDGMLGYVYALDKILGEKFAKEGKACRQMVINHISLRIPKDNGDRFKRSFLQYTPSQLEEFAKRQLSTFKRLFELVILEEVPQWNTLQCVNMYYHDCPYKKLHEQPPENRANYQRAFYQIKPAWNPYRND